MKKSILSLCLFTTICVFASCAKSTSYEHTIQINDKITIGTSRAYECSATIAHLAGFEEYNNPDFEQYYKVYDDYFSKYMKDKRVVKAISYFQELHDKNSFSYDAVANIATYLANDCSSFRIEDENVLKENIQSRCGDPKKLQKIIKDFYDATKFQDFYDSQRPLYDQALDLLYSNKDIMISGVNELEKYYRTEVERIYISVSYLSGYNNYGTSFTDGTKIYFEPKYSAAYFDTNTFVHELSHPFSNKAVDEILKNKKILQLVEKDFTGEKKAIMEAQAYGKVENYLYELFNRANTNNILKGFCDDLYVAMCIVNDKRNRFDEIEEVVALMDRFRTGGYNSIYDFLPELEEEYIYILENVDTSPKPFKLSSDDTKSFVFLGKTYEAEYCGMQDLTGFRDYVCRKYWRLKNAYSDVCMYDMYDYLPYNNYPLEVNTGDVFRIEYLKTDGTGDINYLRSDGDEIYGEPITKLFYSE